MTLKELNENIKSAKRAFGSTPDNRLYIYGHQFLDNDNPSLVTETLIGITDEKEVITVMIDITLEETK